MRDAEAVRKAGCEGKKSFSDAQLAHDVADKMRRSAGKRRKGARRKLRFRVYRCSFCGKWHVGTESPGRRKEVA